MEAIDARVRSFVFSVLDSAQFYQYVKSHAAGTTNSHQRVDPADVLAFRINIPTPDVMERFCDLVTPLYSKIKLNLKESMRLAAIRDSLLPKLLSGEVDVSDVKIC